MHIKIFFKQIVSVSILIAALISCSEETGSKKIASEPFMFDKWKSGMSLEAIKAIAKRRGIALKKKQKTRYFDPIKRNSSLFSDLPSKTMYELRTGEYEYKKEIFGKKARVSFHITPVGRRLSCLSISWEGNEMLNDSEAVEKAATEAVMMMHPKKKKRRNALLNSIVEEISYQVNDRIEIDLRMGRIAKNITMVYRDNEEMRRDEAEREGRVEARKNALLREDKELFLKGQGNQQKPEWNGNVVEDVESSTLEEEQPEPEFSYLVLFKNGTKMKCTEIKQRSIGTLTIVDGPLTTEVASGSVKAIQEHVRAGDRTSMHHLEPDQSGKVYLRR